MNKFWNFMNDRNGGRVLRIEGPIASPAPILGEEKVLTLKEFREELEADTGDITVWINSPGGSMFSAAEIYTMLCDYKGKVTVKIDALAASAASVVAMAGDEVLMSPVACMMIHDPMTIAMGNAKDMEKVITTLNELKESTINAYTKKSGLSHNKVATLMSEETWLNAKKAVELGFADGILFTESKGGDKDDGQPTATWESEWQPFASRTMEREVINRLISTAGVSTKSNETPDATNQSEVLVIGMDGKAQDGSMPYELLRQQLEFLR